VRFSRSTFPSLGNQAANSLMGEVDTSGTSGDSWVRERTEVLKALALFEQALKGVQGDLVEARGEIGRVLAIVERQSRQFNELQRDYATRIAQLDSVRLRWSPRIERRLETLEREVPAKIEERLEEVEKVVPPVKFLMWVAAALGLSIIGLIWALLTGQAQVVFK